LSAAGFRQNSESFKGIADDALDQGHLFVLQLMEFALAAFLGQGAVVPANEDDQVFGDTIGISTASMMRRRAVSWRRRWSISFIPSVRP
jgi:hypothetical protein